MILEHSQTKIVKKLFYLALILTVLNILTIYVLRSILGLDYDDLGYRIVNTLIYSVNPVVLWYLVGKFTKDRAAGLCAIGVSLIIATVLLIMAITEDNISGFDNMFLKSTIGSLSFLAFGTVHHKSAKGLLYVIPFLIFSGLQLGDLHFILDQADNMLRIIDLDGLLQLRIPSSPNSSSHIVYYLIPSIIFFSHVIIQFLIMSQFYYILNKKKWNDFKFMKVQPIEMDKLSFSIIFWVSRFIILSLFFAFIYRMEWLRDALVTKPMMYLWLPSITFATFVFLSFYRNFLVSYFISKNLIPGWRYLLLNIPIINFLTWLHLVLSKTKKDKPEVLNEEEIKKQFGYRENNSNIKATLVFAIVVFTLLKYLNFNGSDKETLLLIGNGLVSLIFLVTYFSNAKLYIPLLLVSFLMLLSLTYINAIEIYPLIMASITNLVLWYPLFHLNKMTFLQENSKDLELEP